MATYKISKINKIPFYINPKKDEVLAEGLTRFQFEELLKEWGYDKTTIVGSTIVSYKNRKNGVYITYQHTGTEYYVKEN